MGRSWRRQVSRIERIRSTKRSPSGVWVPVLVLRHRTAWRMARSARFLVASTSACSVKFHSAGHRIEDV
jgi:hypothetical protein